MSNKFDKKPELKIRIGNLIGFQHFLCLRVVSAAGTYMTAKLENILFHFGKVLFCFCNVIAE